MRARRSSGPGSTKSVPTRRLRSASWAPSRPTPTPPDVVQAEAHYQQALALAEALGMRPLQAHCHLGLGRLYGQIGRREEAHVALSTAIDLYRAMDMTFWLPQTEAALGQISG
jgi:tetratricopeptide (TPR) repeat protein